MKRIGLISDTMAIWMSRSSGILNNAMKFGTPVISGISNWPTNWQPENHCAEFMAILMTPMSAAYIPKIFFLNAKK